MLSRFSAKERDRRRNERDLAQRDREIGATFWGKRSYGKHVFASFYEILGRSSKLPDFRVDIFQRSLRSLALLAFVKIAPRKLNPLTLVSREERDSLKQNGSRSSFMALNLLSPFVLG